MKLFLSLIFGLLLSIGNAFATPQYMISDGLEKTFTEANGLGIVQPGETFAGYEFYFGSSLPLVLTFPDPVQATFTTTFNNIDISSGVIGIVPGESDGFLFDNHSSSLTVSPLEGNYSLRITDFDLVGLPGSTESWIVGSSRNNQSADPYVGIIPLGDNAFTIFGQFDQRNPSEGTFAINVSMPAIPAVPEPETYAMLLIGLLLVGYTIRKRKPEGGGMMPVGA